MIYNLFLYIVFGHFALVQGPQHAATLKWIPSPTNGVTATFIYRAKSPCTSFAKKAQVSNNITTWVDTSVAQTKTYCYYVTGHCPKCSPQDSNPSNKVQIKIP